MGAGGADAGWAVGSALSVSTAAAEGVVEGVVRAAAFFDRTAVGRGDAGRFDAAARGEPDVDAGGFGELVGAGGFRVAGGALVGFGAALARRVGDGDGDGLGRGDGAAARGDTGATPGADRAPPSWKRQPMNPPAGTLREPTPTLA